MRLVVRALPVLLLAGALAAPSALPAQGVLGKLKQKAKERVEKVTEEAMDAGLDEVEGAAKDAVRCAATDKACIAKAEKAGKEVTITEDAASPAGASEGAQSEAAKPRGPRAGEGAWENYDFVPGERVIFADDLSGERVGNFPKRFEFLDGSLQVVDSQGRKWLRAESDAAFAIKLPEKLPERWTLEFDLSVPWFGMIFYPAYAEYEPSGQPSPPGEGMSYVQVGGTQAGIHREKGRGDATIDPRPLFETESNPISGQLLHARLQVDGKYAKFYLNEKRISNVPVTNFVRTNRIVFHTSGDAPGQEAEDRFPTLFGNFSINAGGRPMYDVLMADGRFATQGILFATGSDVLRPESTPTLKEIAAMLQEHPELRLRIEGHTDVVGSAAANQALSEKRAAAVKAHLVKQGIDAGRLQSQGFGATKPVGDNNTAEGRQNNRRVELVKL